MLDSSLHLHETTRRTVQSLLTALCFFSIISIATAAPDSNDSYLKIAQDYADALVEHGTDRYSEQHSAMILSIMERPRLRAFHRMPQAPHGVRREDRATPHGSNVNLDQNMYRVLYALSDLTGEHKYQAAADAALADFLSTTPSTTTALFAWGEHLCWDLKRDTAGSNAPYRDKDRKITGWKYIHEPKRPTVLFDQLYALNPDVMLQYCHAIWEHQIADHKTGNFSRHAFYDRHNPKTDYDFPKEAGYFINDWARAYEKSQDAAFLGYIRVLGSRYLRKLKKTPWNIIEFDSKRGFSSTSANISLAILAHDAAGRLPEGKERDLLLEIAQRIDASILNLPHDLAQGGYLEFVSTNDRSPYPHKEHEGISWLWGMKYGRKTTAMNAVLFYRRATQLEGEKRESFTRLALQGADLYAHSLPDLAERPWPVELGIAASLQLAAYDLTGKQAYLDQARRFTEFGVKHYWDDKSPLPKADPECAHYENITRADTLVYVLLQVYALENKIALNLPISDIDR